MHYRNVSDMSNNELLEFGSNIETYNEKIQEEWLKRYEMNFPYMLDINGAVVHAILGQVIEDEYCDKLILKQAEKIRSKTIRGVVLQ